MSDQPITIPPGMACVTTFGHIQMETVQSLWEVRSQSEKQGLNNVFWTMVPGSLVEKARNDAVRQMLQRGLQWLWFFDGDMTMPPDGLLRLLRTAYAILPHADVVGGYCNLRSGDQGPALPTIDTGTGTWESWYPNSGVPEVMRTGAACLLVKRHVFERMRDPWFRMRVPARPADFMAEFDNFARIKFDGRNPFRGLDGSPWERLEECARQDPSSNGQWTPAEVGEDSGFCDRAKLLGFRLFVDTEVVCGHVDRKVTTWADHKQAMDKLRLQHRQCVGVLT